MSDENNSFGSFVKILIGIGLAVLVFMSYMLAEQQGWVNTNLASRILQGVADGKAARAEKAEAAPAAPRKTGIDDSKVFVDETPAPAAQPAPEPAKPAEPATAAPAETQDETPAGSGEEPAASDESGDSDSSSDDDGDDDSASSDDSGDDSASDEGGESEPAPAAESAPAKPKKLDYAEIARKKSTWPKAVQIRVKGTKIPLLNNRGTEIGKVEIPVGTRVFIRKVGPTGVLEVKSSVTGQVFVVHASRTTFKKLYTGKPISDGLVAAGSASSSSSAASDDSGDDSSGDSDDSGDSDSSSDDSGDDFFDDDF